jgi:hypothetical protein
MRNHENLEALRVAYDSLWKAGTESLRAAHTFGQVVDALSNIYTYQTLGQAINRSPSTVQLYAKLYRRYNDVRQLLHTADVMGTHDVSRLAGNTPSVPVHYTYHCTVCGSYDVVKEKLPVVPDTAEGVTAHAAP